MYACISWFSRELQLVLSQHTRAIWCEGSASGPSQILEVGASVLHPPSRRSRCVGISRGSGCGATLHCALLRCLQREGRAFVLRGSGEQIRWPSPHLRPKGRAFAPRWRAEQLRWPSGWQRSEGRAFASRRCERQLRWPSDRVARGRVAPARSAPLAIEPMFSSCQDGAGANSRPPRPSR